MARTSQRPAEGLGEQFLQLLLGWDALERSRGGPPIIEFNVSGRRPKSHFKSRLGVFDELKALRDEVGRAGDAHLGRRLGAQEAYLRAAMGQQTSLVDYAAATLGATCTPFSDAHLTDCAEDVRARLGELGVAWDSGLETALGRLEPPLSARTLTGAFRRGLDRDRRTLEAVLGRPLRFPLRIEHVDVHAYWSYWVDTHRGRFRLRINGRRPVPPESVVSMFVHLELLAHCGQLCAWRDEIGAGRLDPHHGVTTAHGPEQFVLEGLAHTLPLWLAAERPVSAVMLCQIHLLRLKLMILHNLLYGTNAGQAIEACLDRASSLLPSVDREWIVSGTSGVAASPQLRSYLLVYGPSVDVFLNLVGRLGPTERVGLLREFYSSVVHEPDLASRFRNLTTRESLAPAGTNAAPV